MVVKLQVPDNATILFKKGQKVKIGDRFYASQKEASSHIQLSKKLGVKAQDIFQYTKVIVGNSIKKGAIIAEKKKFIGKKRVASPYSGTVKHIDHISGDIIIQTSSKDSNKVKTFFTGEVRQIDNKKHLIELEIAKPLSISAKGTGDIGGEIYAFDEKDYFSFTAEDIKDRIILIHTVQSHIESKIEALGGAGIIYVSGKPDSSLPTIKCTKKEDFERLQSGKYAYVIFSTREKKAFAYN